MRAFQRGLAAMSLIAFALAVQPIFGAGASAAAGDYEIPLSDLKKVEKKKAKKTAGKRHRERKKTGGKAREGAHVKPVEPETSPAPTSPLPTAAEKAMPAPAVKKTATRAETEELEKQEEPEQAAREEIKEESQIAEVAQAAEEPARITHEPYSFVITGKNTVVKAIISGRLAFKSVRCLFRSTEKGGAALVAMAKAEGSQYTYSAIIPPLVSGAQSLSYQFIAVDTLDVETRSQEFVIPVSQTAILPGWQQNPSQELIKVRLEDQEKPLEGFSNIIVEGIAKPEQ